MTKPIPGIKIPFFVADQYPETDDLRCVEIFIPDDDAFMPLLAGLVKLAGRSFNYKGGTIDHRFKLAEMWRIAYDTTDWEQCMTCEDVADCIDENEAVRNALAQWFSHAVDFDSVVQEALQRAFDPSKGGDPIPDQYAGQNQYGAALGCDPDDGWGHIRDGLIERSFQRVQDVLEQIEAVTNNQEMLSQFVNAIPGVGAFFDVIPVTDWILWFDNVRAWMKEEFEAADTIDLRDQIACDLFCIWQQDCSLSLEQIRDYYWSKTITLVPSWGSAFDSMSELATALGTLSTVNFGEHVVYALVGSQYGFLTFINDWFGIHINSLANDLAVGDASDDWETLCDVCPEFFSHRFDFTIDEQAWEPYLNYAQYSAGVGWIEDDTGIIWIFITIPDSGRKITSVRFETADSNAIHAQVATPDDASGGGEFVVPNETFADYTVDLEGVTAFDDPVLQIACRISVDGFVPTTGAIVAITLNGDGSDPF